MRLNAVHVANTSVMRKPPEAVRFGDSFSSGPAGSQTDISSSTLNILNHVYMRTPAAYTGWQLLRVIAGMLNCLQNSTVPLAHFQQMVEEQKAVLNGVVNQFIASKLILLENRSVNGASIQVLQLTDEGRNCLTHLPSSESERLKKERSTVLGHVYVQADQKRLTGTSLLQQIHNIQSSYPNGMKLHQITDTFLGYTSNRNYSNSQGTIMDLSVKAGVHDLLAAGLLDLYYDSSNQMYICINLDGKKTLGVLTNSEKQKAATVIPKAAPVVAPTSAKFIPSQTGNVQQQVVYSMLFEDAGVLNKSFGDNLTGWDAYKAVHNAMFKRNAWEKWKQPQTVSWQRISKTLTRAGRTPVTADWSTAMSELAQSKLLIRDGENWKIPSDGLHQKIAQMLENPLLSKNRNEYLEAAIETHVKALKQQRADISDKAMRFQKEFTMAELTLKQLQKQHQEIEQKALKSLQEADAATEAEVRVTKESEATVFGLQAEELNEKIIFEEECVRGLQAAATMAKDTQKLVLERLNVGVRNLLQTKAKVMMNQLTADLKDIIDLGQASEISELTSGLDSQMRKLDVMTYANQASAEEQQAKSKAEQKVREKITEMEQRVMLDSLRQRQQTLPPSETTVKTEEQVTVEKAVNSAEVPAEEKEHKAIAASS